VKQLRIDEQAVIDLPMRLLISIVLGCIVITTALGFIDTIDLIPSEMMVNINPIIYTINSSREIVNISIHVSSRNGKPIEDALVVVRGLGGLSYNRTNEEGLANLSIQVELPEGVYEGYLDVSIEAEGFSKYIQRNLIKIIHSKGINS